MKKKQLQPRKFKKIVGNEMRKQMRRDKDHDEAYYISRMSRMIHESIQKESE